MIVRSDVSVYQIFQRFRLRKPEFPGRWTAKPLSHRPIPLPFLLFLTPFSFLSISYFFLFSFSEFFFFLYPSRFRMCVSSSLCRFLGSCFQFCAGKEAEQHSFVSSTLSSASSKLSYPELPQLFLFSYVIRRSFSSLRLLRIVAKLIRLTSRSRSLDHRRATL